ncbi:hypothetical protein DC3_21320 [Deinococcus cellulosilyticus NBRC 106333 = KACC 11606]|uniref:N-acetyltransferase domain-containing protein n=2 Tax=Deinococcus cellulosilyticus TaxID=401558 RepID=A0A511N1V1_DEIC1|nr:hypothetical protein DC3_21320 [Deinococcus cellulosilyticus NBRC 106333 = KACC 11606]
MADVQDAKQISDLCVAAYQEYRPFVGEEGWQTMRAGLGQAWERNPQARWAVIEEEGHLQACVAYFSPGAAPHPYFPDQWAYLRFLAVHPEARGKGHARRLMEWCIEQARQDQATHLGLHTSQQAGYGYRLYERLGFIKDQDLPDFRGLPYVRYVLQPVS